MLIEHIHAGFGVVEVSTKTDIADLIEGKTIYLKVIRNDYINYLGDLLSSGRSFNALLNDDRTSESYGMLLKVISISGNSLEAIVIPNIGNEVKLIDSLTRDKSCGGCTTDKCSTTTKTKTYNFLHLNIVNKVALNEAVKLLNELETLNINSNMLREVLEVLTTKDPQLTKFRNLFS